MFNQFTVPITSYQNTISGMYQSGHGGNISIASTKPICEMGWTPYNEIYLRFNSVEKTQEVTLTFEPEKNISANELVHIQLLLTLAAMGGVTTREAALIYIRKNALERHWKFSS